MDVWLYGSHLLLALFGFISVTITGGQLKTVHESGNSEWEYFVKKITDVCLNFKF